MRRVLAALLLAGAMVSSAAPAHAAGPRRQCSIKIVHGHAWRNPSCARHRRFGS